MRRHPSSGAVGDAGSVEPDIGTPVVRKFVLFSMGFLAVNFVTSELRARISHSALLSVGAVTASVAIGQFFLAYQRFSATRELSDDPTVLARITGFMGHWMTFSGEQLLVWCAAIPAVAVLGRTWLAPLSAVGAALILSFTRSVWVGAVAGLGVIAFTVPKRLLLGVLLPMAVVSAAAGGLIYHRFAMSTQANFAPDTGRIEMLFTGTRMVQEHPFFGVGPERISREFPRYYGGDNLNNFYYGHLHNNLLQIAAERGLLCLATFFWLIFAIYGDLIAMLKSGDSETRWMDLSALAALTGFVVAGFFEYNFGDSEVLLLLLFIVSVPYGVTHDSETRLHTNVGSDGVPV